MLGELNDMQIENLLQSRSVGRIACCKGSNPYIVPVTYTYDGKNIYGQTNKGMKLDIMRKNPKVCFQVDLMSDMANWQSVIVYGSFEELKGKKEKEARDILLDRIFPLMTSSTVHPHEHGVNTKTDDSNRIKPVMYRIKIKKKTGRFEKR